MYSAIPRDLLLPYEIFIPIYAVLCMFIFWLFKLYKSIWRFAGTHEIFLSILATAATLLIHVVGIGITIAVTHTGTSGRMPISYYAGGIVFQFAATVGMRFSYSFYIALRDRSRVKTENRVMIIGAGAAGQMILKELRQSSEQEKVCCFIDDNPNKWGRYMMNVPVVGGRGAIFANVKKYRINKIIFAIPSATAEQKRDILAICSETDCMLKRLPLLYSQVGMKVTARSIADVSIEDLLGRETITVNAGEVFGFITGNVVLVTGGGGSIGGELCRQIASHNPKTLIIFDIYENSAYDIQLELRHKYPLLELVTLIGSVRDSLRLKSVFDKYRPDIVFHAAAHKHVPLMEESPCESIKSNVFGTYKTAYAAMTHGCKRFVLISTDKAVNPTNIMGASKRLCEMVVQSFDKLIEEGRASEIPNISLHGTAYEPVPDNVKTEFVAVRFGNVLGSNGSVVPIFKKQILRGGPVTVTHPDIIRYFMTVTEAVGLVLQAGVYARGGEIFVLDMGSPVKIDSLARNLIRLSGLRPDVDIQIQYTGLRPGEKLYEEKLMAEEGLQKTDNDLIYVGRPLDFDPRSFIERMDELLRAASCDSAEIRALVEDIVPSYTPDRANAAEREPVTV